MRKLYKETLQQYVKILLMCILSVIAVEQFFGIYRIITGEYDGATFVAYILKKCIAPSVINFCILIATKWFLENPNIKVDFKPHGTFVSMALVVLIVCIFHSDYMALYGAFMLPVMVASVFGKREYIRLAVEISALGQGRLPGNKLLYHASLYCDFPACDLQFCCQAYRYLCKVQQ